MTASAESRKGSQGQIIVLDTNVLLADPNAILSFPYAEIVIPETVLGELDKLKTARVDPDLRFRGREVSRLLFELSEEGSLVEGVDLADGGRLRVAPFESDQELPEGLSARNSDDRILATAYSVCKAAVSDCQVRLVTNDLNMLLKAQTLGVPVDRYGEGVEGGFAKRYIIRPFQRYRIPISILAIAVAVFAGVVAIALLVRPQGVGEGGIPTELRQILSTQQQTAADAIITLQSDPNNEEALKAMADFYYDAVNSAQAVGNRASVLQLSRRGISYYEDYLELQPDDHDARADMASLLFYAGQTDKAIQQVGIVLDDSPNHVNANFNLGIILLQGRDDPEGAADQMETVIRLTEDKQDLHAINQQARLVLQRIQSGDQTSTPTTEGVVQ